MYMVSMLNEMDCSAAVFSHKEASLLSLAEAVRLLSIRECNSLVIFMTISITADCSRGAVFAEKPLAAALAVIEREEEVYKLQRRSVQQRRILEQVGGIP